MIKKYKSLIIIGSILIIAAGGWWYFNKNSGNSNNKQKEKISFTTGFILLDDEKGLTWSEKVELTAEARAQFEKKVAEIKAGLAVKTLKEDRLADFNNLAIYQKYLGNYRASYNAYLESLKLENRARVAWQNFADVLLKMKAYKSSEMAYKKAIELNQYIPESYVKLADYYKDMGNGEKVEATYKLAIETIKQSIESDVLVLGAYADWLADNKRYEEAIKLYQELIIKQPENREAIERRIEEVRK